MQKPTDVPAAGTALERLRQSVEEHCNSDEGLLRLAKALLAHEPKSDTEMRYIRALVEYVLAKRRLDIWRKRNVCMLSGIYDPNFTLERNLEIARVYRDNVGTDLVLEEGTDFLLELKKRVGAQISFGGAYRTLSRGPFTPQG